MRIVVAFVLFVVFYFVGCALLGGIAGGIAGANDPQHAATAGRIAGAAIVIKYRGVVAVVAAVAALFSCFLPKLLARLGQGNPRDYFDNDSRRQ